MKLSLNFKELNKQNTDIAGGKGASLGEMTQAGIPVPPGFVVLSTTFETFIKEADLIQEIDNIIDNVNHKDINSVEVASEKIQALIKNASMPENIAKEIEEQFKLLDTEYVAVRSSATAEDGADNAWAGQLDSYLNTKKENLLEKVQHCWASLFTPRAIFYRFEKGLHTTKISVAVVIQKMVNSEISGIAFSVHPVTEDRNQMIIEAGFGLGEAIVSGQVTPDSYVVEKEPRRIIDTNINTQTRGLYRVQTGGNEWIDIPEPKASSQVLTDSQVLDFADLIMRIENHYGFPCDIEWAYESGKFYIVQSRPITTLMKKGDITVVSTEEDIVELLKHTNCQVDWSAPFSVFNCNLAIDGYFKNFNEKFGSNLSFIYISFTKGVATAYLPSTEYENLGLFLADRARDRDFCADWINKFKNTADELKKILQKNKTEDFFDNLENIKKLYEDYTTYQVATKTASNYLTRESDNIIFREFEKARKYSETFYSDGEIIINQALTLLVKQIEKKYSLNQLRFGTLEDVSDIKNNKTHLSPSDFDMRFDRCSLYSDINGIIIFNGSITEEIESVWLKETNNGEIRGNSAYKGIVKGICKIIKDYKKAKINEGEILVTSMTDPNFVPLMKMAGAIVTDGGGLLCHAAIVARELGKPCIIGTKIATKVLKDGDLVEVDADNGVVRIIENKKEEKIFDKFISRYYCIMHLEKYNQFLGEICEEIGISKFYPIFVYDSEKRLSTIYYNTSELDTLIKGICKKTDEDLIFRERVISEYKKYFNEVKEYLDLSIKINSKKEFEKFSIIFENYLKYNAYNWVLSGANLLSKETKEESEKLRKETEAYASKRDKVLEFFAKELFYNDDLDVFFMSSLEFINEKYNIDEIKERENGFLWCNGEIILKRNISQFLVSKNFNLREPILDDSSIIKGTIANKGCVNGIVKIIYTERDLFRITSEEDILVSPMTRPEFIPAIKKAKAIITDEGGITCHAAIVSRELNKPCIIGTKIATQALKDGDLVEVDANNGVVRILNKQNYTNVESKTKLYDEYTKSLNGNEPFTFSGPYSGLFTAIPWSCDEYYKKYYKTPAFNFLFLGNGRNSSETIDNDKYRLYSKEIFEKFFLGKTTIEDLEYDFNQLFLEAENLYEKKIDDPKARLKDCFNLFLRLFAVTVYIEKFDKKIVEEVVGKQIDEKDWESATHPFFESFVKRWNKKLINNKNIDEIRYIFNDYYFIKSDEYILNELKNIKSIEDNNEAKEMLIDESWAKFTQFVMKLRDLRKDPIAKIHTIIALCAKKLYPEATIEQLVNLNLFEVFNDNLPDISELEKRRNGYVLFINSDLSYKISYDEYEETKNKINSVNNFDGTLKGVSASKGVVRGRVKIVLDPDNNKTFNDGEVLVTSMTRPEFLSLMKKSVAIVTNEGGITCHAAIVSRELGIPCIIGTKVATKVLKDGDLVEVDANSGIVRVLENKKEEKVVYKVLRTRKVKPIPCIWNQISQTCMETKELHNAGLIETWYYFNKDGNFTGVTIEKEWNEVGEIIKNRLIHEKEYLNEIYKKQIKYGQDLVVFSHKIINEDLSNKQLDDLIKYYKTVEDGWLKFDLTNTLPWFIGGDFFQKYLYDKAQSEFKLNEEDFNILVTSPKGSFSADEEMGIIEIVVLIKNGGLEKLFEESKEKIFVSLPLNIQEKIKQMVEKYFWIPFGYDGPEIYDINHYVNTIKSELNKDTNYLSNRLDEIKKYEVNTLSKQDKIIQTYNLPKDFVELIKKVQILSLMTDQRKEFAFQSHIAFNKVIEEISVKLNLPKDLLKYITYNELNKDYKNTDKLKDIYDYRKNNSVFVYCKNGEISFIENTEEVKKLEDIMLPKVLGTDVIKGTTVSLGTGEKITGRVKILLHPREMNKLDENEILVTTMTTPEYVPAMRKSLAIITDEGGVTCHAAIVSRELKKVCIIGTKNATKILKDGDLVEIDVNNGTVKIIKDDKKQLIEKAKTLEWSHWLERPYGPFIATLNFAGVDKKYFQKIGLDDFGYEAFLYQYPMLYNSEKIVKDNDKALEKYLEEKSIFDLSNLLTTNHEKNKEEIKSLIESNLSPIDKLIKVREMTRIYFPFLWIVLPLEKYYNKILDKEVPKYFNGNREEIIGIAGIPEKNNSYGEMLDMIKKGSSLDIVKDKFSWLKSRDGFTDFYTIEELEEIKSNIKTEEKGNKVEIPKELQKLFAEIKELNFFRTARTDAYYEMLGLARPVFTEVSEYFKIPFKDLANYDADSIIEGNPVSINKPYNFLFIDNKQFVQYDPIIHIEKKSNNEIKGSPAFAGVVKGIVKIVTHPNDLGKVNTGDILVTQMTLPSFISAMQKAVAFVTDEGSITCHAAIIAREMKKPCITGTKNATKILKDGDFVEVDANNGVVKVLNRPSDFPGNLVLANQDIDISWINLEVIWDGMIGGEIKEQVGFDFPRGVCEMKNGKTTNLYIEAESLKNFINLSAKKVLDDKNLLDLYKEKTIETTGKIREYAISLFDEINHLSSSQILEILPKIKKLQSEAMIYGCVVAFADVFGEITNKVTDILIKRDNLKYSTNVYSAVLTFPEKTLTQKAYEDISESKLSDSELLKKYFWLDQGYIGRGLTEEELTEIKNHKVDKEVLPSEAEILDELKLNKEEKSFFDVSKTLILIKSLRSDSRQFLNVIVSRIIDKLAKELKIKAELLETLYVEELCDVLKGNNKIIDSLQERYKHSIFIDNGRSNYQIILGDEASHFLNERILKIDIEKTKEIIGQVANPGKVTGIVKIVFGPQHINKINDGDILVSTATSPQLLLAMKKAAAFVTDVGGITSHAAIVARELKKPCIVGTKNATQILKDGDLVEVDADNGVVRIIK